ncbi:hypothetical protein [Methylocystis sp. S23]
MLDLKLTALLDFLVSLGRPKEKAETPCEEFVPYEGHVDPITRKREALTKKEFAKRRIDEKSMLTAMAKGLSPSISVSPACMGVGLLSAQDHETSRREHSQNLIILVLLRGFIARHARMLNKDATSGNCFVMADIWTSPLPSPSRSPFGDRSGHTGATR